MTNDSAELAVAQTGGEVKGLEEALEITVAPSSWIDQALRFGLVGVINTAVDLGIFNSLVLLSRSGRSGYLFSLFKTISFMVAVTNSYLLNRRFTFRSQKAASGVQMSQYLVVSLVGLAINVGVATAVNTYVPAPFFLQHYWYTIAPLVGIPFGLIWNFLGYRFIVF